MSILLNWFVILSSFAIEPTNPEFMCADRGLIKKDYSMCMEKTKLKLDWYAATACHAIQNNQKFMKCLQDIVGGDFNNEALNRCVENIDNSDESILTCILSVKNKRIPASIQSHTKERLKKRRSK